MSKPNYDKLFVIVDDHPIMRKGLALTLESELENINVKLYHSAEELIDDLPDLKPDFAIIDLSLPGMSGLDLIKHINDFQPDAKTLVLSRHDEMLYANRVIKTGAGGYLMKVEAGEKLIEAVQKILDGGVYVSQAVNEKLLKLYSNKNASSLTNPLDSLSDRELEVYECIGRGLKTEEIANKMHISVKTVESYRARIKQKLNISNLTDLIRHAVKWIEN